MTTPQTMLDQEAVHEQTLVKGRSKSYWRSCRRWTTRQG